MCNTKPMTHRVLRSVVIQSVTNMKVLVIFSRIAWCAEETVNTSPPILKSYFVIYFFYFFVSLFTHCYATEPTEHATAGLFIYLYYILKNDK